MIRMLSILMLTTMLVACASGHILTGKPRPPIDPSQVRVYFAPPPNGYEEIALLESNSGAFTYGEQNKMNSVIGKLRVEAAKLGANGVLFQGTEDGYGGSGMSVGAGGGRVSGGGNSFSSGGVGVSISPRQKFARGVAVYVANPPPIEAAPPPPPPPPPRN